MLRCSVLVCIALLMASLPAQAQQPQRLKTEKAEIIVETVARGLDHPWGLTFLPDGRMLVTERPGRLRIVSTDGQVSLPLGGVPRVYVRDQGGLLDVALDPKFSENRLVYLTYSEPARAGRPRLPDVVGSIPRARRSKAFRLSSDSSQPFQADFTSAPALPSYRTASCSSRRVSASSSIPPKISRTT